jgi:hypothetical protein
MKINIIIIILEQYREVHLICLNEQYPSKHSIRVLQDNPIEQKLLSISKIRKKCTFKARGSPQPIEVAVGFVPRKTKGDRIVSK